MERVPEPELMDLPDEAAAYAAADFSSVNAVFVERLLELTDALQAVHAIDLGTGPGDIAMRVAAQRPAWRMDAVDAAPAMIEIARRNLSNAHSREIGRALTFHLADATRTNLASASYNVIFSNSLLHHLPDPLPLWAEIRRLARPGAVVFLRDLVRPATASDARAIVDQHAGGESKLLQDEFYRSLLAAFTVDEVRAQLDDAGLSSLVVDQVTDRHLDVHGVLA
jgi:ubiquinone/menaquinone biosynthesis C-methylase UbiE